MKKDDVIKDLVRKWIKKADNDLLSSKRGMAFDDPVLETVCFHCQQAVEKYLKAFLVYHQVYFPKTHKILQLLELCSSIDPSFREELLEADNLTDYAVEIRYPDVWLEPKIKEAEDAIKITQHVRTFVLARMDIDNLTISP